MNINKIRIRTTKKAAGAGLIFLLQRLDYDLFLLQPPFNKTDNNNHHSNMPKTAKKDDKGFNQRIH
ncbi:hypothetical protein HY612_00565 [Candidatus Roizmanbacteria bacterium]|nr:hypothetical protein [Candidatus Roizmanbacteria bacterium]